MKTFLYKLLGWWRLNTKANFGVLGGYKRKEFRVGAVWKNLQPNGQWESYLPRDEYQRYAWGDTMACVTYSFYNTVETLLKRKYNEQWDFSDRFTAKMSGTTKKGNWMYKVADSFVEDGFLSFLLWRNSGNNWDEYYSDIPQKKKDLAIDNGNTFELSYEWVEPTNSENIKEALRQSPLWIAIHAYGPKKNGVYQRAEGSINHCVEMFGYDEAGNWLIKDHYLGNEIRKLAPDYLIGFAAKIDITKN